MDKLAVYEARSILFGSMISIGWRLAIMVLLPIFIGTRLDERFDTSPSYTLAAFFIAMMGSALLIYRTYNDLQREALMNEAKKSKPKVKRTKNA